MVQQSLSRMIIKQRRAWRLAMPMAFGSCGAKAAQVSNGAFSVVEHQELVVVGALALPLEVR